MTTPKAYEAVTRKVIELIEAGNLPPWRKPWRTTADGGLDLPKNLISQKNYRGSNLYLGIAPFASSYWLTFKQAKAKGGSVRKGEKGFPVIYASSGTKETPEGKDKAWFALRHYTVFNVEQCDDVEYPIPEPPKAVEPFQAIEKAESINVHFLGPKRQESSKQSAYYSPSRDIVHLPNRETFESPESFYRVLFHELTHSTGHESRLDRKFGQTFGSHAYSQEELVAEFGSTFLSSAAGILVEPEQSASYLSLWLSKLKANPEWLPKAASQAQKAVDLILGN